MNYIYPPRAETSLPRNDYAVLEDLDYIAQLKYNDTRCLIWILEDGRIQLWNRHAERIKNYTPPIYLQEQLEALPFNGETILDGGLIHHKHSALKNTIVIWDILVNEGNHLLETTYLERYNLVKLISSEEPYYFENKTGKYKLGDKINDDIFIPNNLTKEHWGEAWELVDSINKPYLDKGQGPLIEGLVFKDPDGTLEPGFKEKNNSSWMVRSRVTTERHRF